MSPDDLCFVPGTHLAQMVKNREISPTEIVTAVLDRIEKLEPGLNAFATITPELALVAAKAAEASVAARDVLGPLHGVPVTIKDLVVTSDIKTEYGSHLRAGFTPDTDAPAVTRLREAGAIVLGKTTTSEFGWSGVSRSPLTGITHNPWKRGFNAGASSAGAGVAAAAGYAPMHLGSDGAGSIRMPAHFCGVFGIKPTFGRVPNFPISNTDYTSHLGPLTRTVADSALMLQVMAGPHPWDHTSCESPPADYVAGLRNIPRGIRIAFSPDLGHARVDHEVATLVAQAVTLLARELGTSAELVTPDWGPLGKDLASFMWPAHLTIHARSLANWQDRMDPGLVACIRAGAGHDVTDYQRMRERKLAYCVAIHRFFETWDYLVTPAASVAAFPADLLQPPDWPQHEWDWMSWAQFSYPFNFSGSPAASIPCGFTTSGLPVGLQIVGRRFDDLGVLRLAAAFERVQPWANRRPRLPFD